MEPNKSRAGLSLDDKRAICCFKRDRPSLSRQDVLDKFIASKQGVPGFKAPEKSTVGKILKQSATWLTEDDRGGSAKRQREGQYPLVDAAALLWFRQGRAQSLIISGTMVQSQALAIAKALVPAHPEHESFVASAGWLSRFQSRAGIKSYTLAGEAGSADQGGEPAAAGGAGGGRQLLKEVSRRHVQVRRLNYLALAGVLLARAAVPAIIEEGEYALDFVFNMDETGLIFRAQPTRTLGEGQVTASARPGGGRAAGAAAAAAATAAGAAVGAARAPAAAATATAAELASPGRKLLVLFLRCRERS
jgi:hypothetical protein